VEKCNVEESFKNCQIATTTPNHCFTDNGPCTLKQQTDGRIGRPNASTAYCWSKHGNYATQTIPTGK